MRAPDWNHMRAFHATAATGSLSAAARLLGLTQPTLSRQVAALEAELGVTLFERVGKKLVVTETGLELFEHVQAMGKAAHTVALAASGRAEAIAGRVNISVTDVYSAYVLPTIAERIRATAPQITISIVSTNALSDLHHREADIAVRHVRPVQAGLIAKHVRDTSAHFYASRDWVRRNGLPSDPSELADGRLIGFADTERYSAHLRGMGIHVAPNDFRLISDSSIAIWEMVRRGMGVAAMVREVAERTPDVVQLFPTLESIPVPIWLVTHRELRTSRRIRLVFDILAEELAAL